jgi:hypothetical protein
LTDNLNVYTVLGYVRYDSDSNYKTVLTLAIDL